MLRRILNDLLITEQLHESISHAQQYSKYISKIIFKYNCYFYYHVLCDHGLDGKVKFCFGGGNGQADFLQEVVYGKGVSHGIDE